MQAYSNKDHESDQGPVIQDLIRNIAGLDDSNLYVSSHAILVQAVREWREEARKILFSA